jgi:hypothetical protein
MKVVTSVVNNPLFIQIQYHTLKKYMKCDYEFIVFNDAKDFSDYSNGGDIMIRQTITMLCDKLNIKCIEIPNRQHKVIKLASIRTANAMNYMLKYQIDNPDVYLVLDSDMFLIDYFDINDYTNYAGSFVLQTRQNGLIKYFWNGLCIMDITKMKNLNRFNWNCYVGCDTGGMTQFWLETQNKSDFLFMKHLSSCNWTIEDLPKNIKNEKIITFLKNDSRNVDGNFFCEIYDNKFLHYRAGGNWENKNMKEHIELSIILKKILVE